MASQALPLVLELSRAEKKADPAFVLLLVSGVEGGQLLDLKLVGTDSSEVFVYTLKHSKISKLKAKSSPISQEEWEAVLAAKLLLEVPEDDGFLEGVEAVAEVEGEKTMTVIIQKRIEGITQRLGQLVLTYTEEEDINLFEWTGLAIKSNINLKHEFKTLQTSLKDKDEQLRKLEETLSELTELKNQNENNLLEKFSLLLNEKKLKIREQQTLLASANIGSMKPEDMEIDEPISAGPSRPRKRKAGKVVEEESGEDNAAVKMEVDKPGREPETESDEADQNTASETESDSDTMPSSSITKQPAVKAKSASPPTQAPISPPRRRTRGASAQPEKQPANDEELPPPRTLPFQSKTAAKKAAPTPPVVPVGSETESDDEL